MSDAPGTDATGGQQVDTQVSIGAQLGAARKKRKLKIEKVAHDLRLDIDVIKALENDERDKLPAPIFVQGYLKSYGRLVGLPVEKLIKDYNDQVGEPPPLSVIRSTHKLPAVRQRSIKLIRNVIVLLLVGILLWMAWPFAEQFIDSRRESTGERMPGRLELPPASELGRNDSLKIVMNNWPARYCSRSDT